MLVLGYNGLTGCQPMRQHRMQFHTILKAAQNGDLGYFKEHFPTESFKNLVLTGTHQKSGDTVLHYAARHGHLNLLTFLVQEGFKLETGNFDGKRPLHEAAQYSQYDCLKFLLSCGVNCDCLKRADWTPLMLACTKDSIEVIQCLVDHGANLCLRNKDGWNCFHIAVREGYIPVIQYLLQQDGSLWDTVSKNGRTPLHTAALHGHYEVVEYLLDAGHYKPDVKDSCGSTPFMDALRIGNTLIAQLLLDKQQVNVSSEDNLGRQALHVSAQTGALGSIRYLVEDLGVNPAVTCSGNGASALHIAAKEDHTEVLLFLLNLGVDVNITDSKARTALHIAAGAQHADCVRVLLEKNAQCKPDNSGTSPVQLAIKQEVISVFKEFDIT